MASHDMVGSDSKPRILVLTASNTEQVGQKFPSSVEGYPVVVRFVGEIREELAIRYVPTSAMIGVPA